MGELARKILFIIQGNSGNLPSVIRFFLMSRTAVRIEFFRLGVGTFPRPARRFNPSLCQLKQAKRGQIKAVMLRAIPRKKP